jgi:hypothetical protein
MTVPIWTWRVRDGWCAEVHCRHGETSCARFHSPERAATEAGVLAAVRRVHQQEEHGGCGWQAVVERWEGGQADVS